MQRRDLLKFFGATAALPPESLFRADPEAYWTQLRKEQFLLPDWRHFLNNGSLGVTPKPVLKAVTDYLERAAALLMDDYPRWGYETLDAERTKMAAFAGCKPNELAFTHNATEAISIVAAGVDLKAGDEVLITDQEHVSGKNPWFLRAQRTGITVREVKLPVPPRSTAELADVFTSAIGPRTKMISFSGIVSALGFRMPAREICDYARSKGILTLVDGAHMHGQVAVKISDLHCDFFAGSPHKWLFAPAGCGLLYVREEMLDRLWPSIVTGNWDNRKLGAARFMQVGTNNRAIIEGMMAGLDFHNQIGSERVFGRIHELAKVVYQRASEVPYVKLLSPADDTMWGGLVSFEIAKDAAALWPRLKERKVWTTGASRLRVSTHVHTRREDIEALFEILRETLG